MNEHTNSAVEIALQRLKDLDHETTEIRQVLTRLKRNIKWFVSGRADRNTT